MGKVLELSEDTYERLRVLAQQRQCTLEELIHTFLVDYEQVQYYQANQQMLAQGILASIPRTPCGSEGPSLRSRSQARRCRTPSSTIDGNALVLL
jgi:hypothetical protein